MNHIATTLKYNYSSSTIVPSNKINKTIDYSEATKPTDITTKQLSIAQADSLISHVADLIDDDNYKPFFYKRLYKLGARVFLDKADQARQARVASHAKLFCKLLKDTPS